MILFSLGFIGCGSSIESKNDRHLKNLEKALDRGDIKEAGREVKYLDDYDDNGGVFTIEQEQRISELERKYPQSIREAVKEKDRLNGK